MKYLRRLFNDCGEIKNYYDIPDVLGLLETNREFSKEV